MDPWFDRPIFILSSPRAGSTLLYEVLSNSSVLWTVGGESHAIIEGIPELRITHYNFASNFLPASAATPEIKIRLKKRFIEQLRNFDKELYQPAVHGPVRFLEKTPKNSLRIEFLNELFPDALFVYLVRQPAQNISSIIEAWRSGRFVTYPRLPGWTGPWSLLLPGGWQRLVGRPLVDIAAYQWASANYAICTALKTIAPMRWLMLDYDQLVNSPDLVVKRIAEFCDISVNAQLVAASSGQLALSRYTLTPPDPNKWKNNKEVLMSVWSQLTPYIDMINQLGESWGVRLDSNLPE